MEAVAADSTTVVLSSHLVTDLERVCDHLLILTEGRIRVGGDIDTLLAGHKVLIGPRRTHVAGVAEVIEERATDRQMIVVARLDGPFTTRPGKSAASRWRNSCWPTWAAACPTRAGDWRW